MVSFLAKVQIFNFWPKTVDYNYSQVFWPKLRSFFDVFLLFTGRCYEAEFLPLCSPLDVLLHGIVCFFVLKSKTMQLLRSTVIGTTMTAGSQ